MLHFHDVTHVHKLAVGNQVIVTRVYKKTSGRSFNFTLQRQ